MKLSTITTENWRSTGDKLNYICGSCVCEADYHNSKPISILFVESAFAAGLVTEAEAGVLTTLFRAGLAKLQAALTPNTPQDLDSLLTFVASEGGGLQKVQSLLQAAKASHGSITNNQEWWNELFHAFNITDAAVQREIQNQVITTVGGQPTPQQAPQTQPEQQPEQQPGQVAEPVVEPTPEPTPRQTTPPPRTTPRDWFSDLQQERQRVLDQQNRMADLLAHSRSMRQDTSDRLQAIAKRLEELKAQGATESLAIDYATIILEFPRVRNNLPAIVELMVRSGGRRFATITEAGLINRANQAIGAVPGFLQNLTRHAADITANPRYAQRRYQESYTSSTNERVAKLAIKLLTDHVRKAFGQKLQTANATPQEIINGLGRFQGYQERLNAAAGADPASIFSPEELNEYKALQQKLRTVYRLFNKSKRPFNTPRTRPQEAPMDAEIVDDPLEADEADEDIRYIEPPELPRTERVLDYLEQQRMVPTGITRALRLGVRKGQLNSVVDILKPLLTQKYITGDQVKQIIRAIPQEQRSLSQ